MTPLQGSLGCSAIGHARLLKEEDPVPVRATHTRQHGSHTLHCVPGLDSKAPVSILAHERGKLGLMLEVEDASSPVRLVGRVEAQVGDVGCVEAGEALHLVRKAAALVPCLQQLAPHCVEALVVVLQQLAVPVPHLHSHSTSSHRSKSPGICTDRRHKLIRRCEHSRDKFFTRPVISGEYRLESVSGKSDSQGSHL